MVSALLRKSVTDLSRRRSRTFFAVVTLSLAVASVGIFAIPSLMDGAMQAEVEAGKLPDLSVYTNPLVLDRAQLAGLAALPNVQAVEPRSYYAGRVYVGARRAPAYVEGVRDFARQNADVVHLDSGAWPRAGEVLTEVQNANQGVLDVGVGDTVQMIGTDGSIVRLRVSGVGRNLDGGQDVTADDEIVLYATAPTVASLGGGPGYGKLAFRLDDTRASAIRATLAELRQTLPRTPGFTGFTGLPEIRAAGDWPGKSDFEAFGKFFYVITALALLSAFVLIANTMTTLVAEQTSEIGMMKAIGGRRRQIALAYVKTALLLGLLGTLVGGVLGVVLSNVLVRFLGSTFFAIDVGFGVDWMILAASALVGLVGPALFALPAIRRATRVPLREALEATGSAVGAQDAGDELLRRVRFLPRTAQIGLRSVGRRRRRSLGTALMVALAVGNLLAVLGLAASVSDTTHVAWRDHGEDVKVVSVGGRPLDEHAARLMQSMPEVQTVEPMFESQISYDGKDAYTWAVVHDTMFRYHLVDGRWFTPAEQRASAHVAVLERNLARVTDTHVGERVTIETASGPATVRVIGIARPARSMLRRRSCSASSRRSCSGATTA